MPTPFNVTVNEVIRRTCVQLALATASNAYTSTDAIIVQLREFLRDEGCALAKGAVVINGAEEGRGHTWSQLLKEHAFTTVSGTANYALPADFQRPAPLTLWDRSNDTFMPGPLSAQDYQYLKAWGQSVAGYVLLRLHNQRIELYPDTSTPGGVQLAFEYVSSYWVAPTATPTVGTKEAPDTTSDVALFDPDLLVAALKYRWRSEKGFDTASAGTDYRGKLAAAIAADSPGQVLDAGGRRRGVMLIGEQNIPLSGWAS